MTPHEPVFRGDPAEPAEPPVFVSRILRTLRAYWSAILLALGMAAVAYTALAVFVYLRAPSHVVTSQPFRLEFKGAEAGTYPNGVRFGSSDIVATPILLDAFNANRIERYMPFSTFARGVYVLEQNPAYPPLAADYTARMADPKLSAVDRHRLQEEFESKRASLAKNEYAIAWMRDRRDGIVPEDVARKTLVDIVHRWARFATAEQRVLEHRVSLLSPSIVNPGALDDQDVVVSIHLLHGKIRRVLAGITEIETVPGAEMLRARSNGLSLAEVRLRLEEIIRFRLDPLIDAARNSGLVRDLAATQVALESHLAYDERQLQARRDTAEVVRQSLLVYTRDAATQPSAVIPAAAERSPSPQPRGDSDAVNTQLTDSFIDRLVSLTTQSTDVKFRQDLVEDFRRAASDVIPAEQAVAYDRAVLERLRRPPAPSRLDAAGVRQEIARTRNDVRQLIGTTNEIHQLLSRSLNPASRLITLTGSATTATRRATDGNRLVLGGVLVLLITLPLAVLAALLHNRVREERSTGAVDDPISAGAHG